MWSLEQACCPLNMMKTHTLASTLTLCDHLSTSCLLMTHVWSFVQSNGVSMGKGAKDPKCKEYSFCHVFVGGRVVRKNKSNSSFWMRGGFMHFFKATILYLLRVAVETNISGEGRKERRRKREFSGIFFHFHFYIKVLRPQWKKFYPYI